MGRFVSLCTCTKNPSNKNFEVSHSNSVLVSPWCRCSVAPLGGALPWARSMCKSAVGLMFSPQSCGRARVWERERDSHVSAFSWGRLRFALRLPGTDSSAAPNGRCGPEPLASKGEMMARLSTGIKVPQQTLPAIKSRKGDAHASPERENSNLRVKLHWKLEQKCRRAKESSGADFVYMHSILYLNYTYCCSQCGNFAARGNTSV